MFETTELLQFIGRLHTVVLHLPIGILTLAFLLEISSRFTRFKNLKPAISFILFCGMLAAVITALFGYFLSQEDGYEGQLLFNHKWMGIATAILTIFLFIFRKNKTLYFPSFIALMLLMIVTGHNGGSLTHGSDFLFEPFTTPEAKVEFVGNIHEVKVYDQLIKPIFKSKCVSCHNAGKVKGGLILSDTMSVMKGGDSGELFVVGLPEKSLLIERIHLPMEVEEHMPPEGKKQLSDEEKLLLKWWISGKADFTSTAAEYPTLEKVDEILTERFVKKKSGIASINISPVDNQRIAAIRDKGLNLNALGSSSPWLEARLANFKGLKKTDVKLLKNVSKNISILDLSNTDFDDKMANQINAFPHLSKLFLNQTKLTDAGLKKINPLKHLEYLNLFGCVISDESIAHLKLFENLKLLYLWQTNITDEGIDSLKKALPLTQINFGKEGKEHFASAQLKPPRILSDSSIFVKELSVDLKLNFPWAKIYYSLDGSDPDSLSKPYGGPFTISKSTTVKAIAFAPNWQPSEVVQETFISVKKLPRAITIDQALDPAYAGEGPKTLIDRKFGDINFKSGKWLGWQGKSINAVLDFGNPINVSSVFVSCLSSNGAWIFLPKQIKVWTSMDGKNYVLSADEKFGIPTESKISSTRKFNIPFEKTEARKIKVQVENIGKNPDWHPSPGKPSWIFVDEIIAE